MIFLGLKKGKNQAANLIAGRGLFRYRSGNHHPETVDRRRPEKYSHRENTIALASTTLLYVVLNRQTIPLGKH